MPLSLSPSEFRYPATEIHRGRFFVLRVCALSSASIALARFLLQAEGALFNDEEEPMKPAANLLILAMIIALLLGGCASTSDNDDSTPPPAANDDDLGGSTNDDDNEVPDELQGPPIGFPLASGLPPECEPKEFDPAGRIVYDSGFLVRENPPACSSSSSCTRNDQCTEGLNGRCVGTKAWYDEERDPASCTCKYDHCLTHEDCRAQFGQYAYCRCGSEWGAYINSCNANDCIDSSDCPEGHVCLLNGDTRACTTPMDECRGPHFCKEKYNPNDSRYGHWFCDYEPRNGWWSCRCSDLTDDVDCYTNLPD